MVVNRQMELITRQQAIQQGKRYYFTGTPCKNGHLRERRVNGRSCLGCVSQRGRVWDKNNRAKSVILHKQWRDRAKNTHKYKDAVYQRAKKWRTQNPSGWASRVRLYLARRQEAQPKWVIKNEVEVFYESARKLTQETGILYTVDHIIPLRHPLVCGLHVPANLRVITKSENSKKNNHFVDLL